MNYKVKESDLIGEIKDFPIEIVQKMVDHQVEQGNEADVKIFQQYKTSNGFIGKGFEWRDTPEGMFFWIMVIGKKNFDLFFEKYPKREASIFKVGDKVFDPYNGWGEVVEIGDHSLYPILVRFVERTGFAYTFTTCGKYSDSDYLPRLSFTEYDPIKATGFSQKRPFPEVKDGQLVYVKSSFDNNWLMRYATGNISERGLETYPNQQKEGEVVTWEKYSLTNPLENKE